MQLTERLRELSFSPRERRVADLVLADPSAVAFGTVASVAAASGVGNSTVMRFATTVGFAGFSDLQAAVRADLGTQLRQATHRVRQRPGGDPIRRALETEQSNLADTFAGIDHDRLVEATTHLARAGRVGIVAGDAARGVATDFATQLGMVRPDVTTIDPASIAIARTLTWWESADALVVIDTARYEATIVDALQRAAARAVPTIAISDSHLSPIGAPATWSFVVSDRGSGPFDSFVATLALTNLMVALVTRHRARRAVRHIDELDAEWAASRALWDPD